ncbi:DUF2752 domain-containing protein [Micromonospora olivasterospora]|uniref:Uncharacterized protein DUF2752 n=1 Tax=Micromonospora olivasterospora TaxID=1880 RepID=A0A562IDK9_MICOL|nr:DUF2752 domain-containing protein [Micromonospora olivasterospora]TWH68936.1 uncharacterized protein DUF2752 [Micromonospora olivasterospora]
MSDVTSVDGPNARPDAAPAADLHAHDHAHGHAPTGAAWPPPAYPAYQVPEPDRFTRFVMRVHDRSPRWAVPLAALGCVGLGMAYALLSDPTRAEPDAAPTCLLKLTTGLDCPGCGGTRALWYVLHGDVPAAARHHFLFVFALPFLAYLFVAWAGRQAFGWRLPQPQVGSKAIGVFLAAWLVFSVARNLPWAPFTSLYV